MRGGSFSTHCGLSLVASYTCPFTNSIDFQSNHSRLHGYVLLLGRLAILPILFLISSLVAACIFSATEQIGLIVANFFINVQAFYIIQQVVLVARLYIDDYYSEFCLWKYKVLSLGGVYLEQIVHNITTENNIIISCAGIIPQNYKNDNIKSYIRVNSLFPRKLNEISKQYNVILFIC